MDYYLVIENLQPGSNSPIHLYEFNDLEEAEYTAFQVSKFCSRVYGVSKATINNFRAYYLLRVFKNFLLTFEEVDLGKFN